MEIIGSKAPGNYYVSIWSYSFSICLWAKPKTCSYDFEMLGNNHDPENQLFRIFGETKKPRNSQVKAVEHILENIMFINH